MNKRQKLLIGLYWILLFLIIVIIALTFNFFMNAFMLIFTVPLFLLVDSAIANDRFLTNSFTNKVRPRLRQVSMVVLGVASLGWLGFALLWTL